MYNTMGYIQKGTGGLPSVSRAIEPAEQVKLQILFSEQKNSKNDQGAIDLIQYVTGIVKSYNSCANFLKKDLNVRAPEVPEGYKFEIGNLGQVKETQSYVSLFRIRRIILHYGVNHLSQIQLKKEWTDINKDL